MNIEFKYNLGQKAKDKVTGYTGVINAVARYINGCNKYSVQAPVDKDMKMPDSFWFDELSIEVQDAPAVPDKVVKTGGPHQLSQRF